MYANKKLFLNLILPQVPFQNQLASSRLLNLAITGRELQIFYSLVFGIHFDQPCFEKVSY